MATRDEICAVCDQYIALLSKGDVEGIVALYDAAARVSITATRLGPVTVVGHEAAFQFRVDVPVGEDTISMVTTDLMTFDDSGKVVAMKAYADMDAKPGT
jgi:steroid Delta-isomerase